MSRKMSLGEFISRRRNNMQLTQEELAKKLNVSKSAIAKWETNGGIPDRDNLLRLADALGVTVDGLHKIINSEKNEEVDIDINITADVIRALESCGYKVIRPGKDK